MPDRPTLLFVFAHPDDESFSGAGTAMQCASRGARTVLVTATRGEAQAGREEGRREEGRREEEACPEGDKVD